MTETPPKGADVIQTTADTGNNDGTASEIAARTRLADFIKRTRVELDPNPLELPASHSLMVEPSADIDTIRQTISHISPEVICIAYMQMAEIITIHTSEVSAEALTAAISNKEIPGIYAIEKTHLIMPAKK